jgi:hypothetical protein
MKQIKKLETTFAPINELNSWAQPVLNRAPRLRWRRAWLAGWPFRNETGRHQKRICTTNHTLDYLRP